MAVAERQAAGSRVVWYGTLSFGLVSVPVGLTVAQSRQEVRFKQLHRGCGKTVKQPKYCEEHGEISASDVTKGYEWAKGEYVEVEEADLDALGPVGGKAISIERFVDVDAVDPIYFDRTYYLTASKEPVERQGYRLLLDAMRQTGKAAVAKFALWGKENLCLIRPSATDDVLVLDALFYGEDIRDPRRLVDEVATVKVSKPEVQMAKQLIASLSDGGFDPGAYRNEHRERVRDLLEGLVKGKKPRPTKAAAVPKATPDLLAGLRASLAAVGDEKKKKGATKAARSPKPTKTTPRGSEVAAKAKAARTRKGG